MKNNVLSYSESDLIGMLLKQDRHAFNYLYDNYSDALYGIVLKIVVKEEAAQDLLQEIFIKIWTNITRYDSGKGRFFTWMLNIARNSSIDYLRGQRAEIQDLESSVYWIESNQTVFGEIENNELRELVSQLKHEQKTIIEMVYWGGYTQNEAAKRLQLPLGTVKTRIRLAIKNLRFHLAANASYASSMAS
ncbi:RNA polymerase sigma factor [Runella slithyformis]|uniref:RNA polymerase, sigma-24 subunit, ECF subfamily n=1 Tax=Runella slithyformis (strain ATCC 29530 / DSM 19594 / LMG 11500 / NCIMB 11436 / LSU 4) TaxID=761193 RepID=A0A7U3ZIG1_RUNSL|nr:sigma-70 family RNA polymerase sigma factor [Runella slithyformis]AEI47798.1 RNA polymerase, sigma-24 subunit, ECF subfamily [Runella slithyformis DSM 19594]